MEESQKKTTTGDDPPTLRCEVVDDVVIMVHGQRSPSSQDWQKFIGALRQTCSHFGRAKILGFTPGPAPNAVQRSEMMAIAKEYPLPIAICTESRLARGAIQALSWASHMRIKPFEKRDWVGACDYLELPTSRAPFFGAIVERLDSELSHASGTFPTATKS